MRRDIDGNSYDTATATRLTSHETDTTHHRRVTTLYQTPDGGYFIVEEQESYGQDGALLIPLTDDMTLQWLEARGKRDLAESLFGDRAATIAIEIDRHLLHEIDDAAKAAGKTRQAWLTEAIEAAIAGRLEPL
ncbi:MAG: hypothetical protein ACFCUO_11970 [Rhodospirillales bacterium]